MDKAEYNAYKRKMRALTRWEYEANPTYCRTCSTKIPYEEREKQFCSRSCAITTNNRGVQRNGDKTPKYCKCGNEITKRANKWCDTCIAKKVYNRPQTFEEIVDPFARRRFLIEERGHRCERCKLETWFDQPIAIEMHHIDGNSDNNTRENLQLLCPNCHAQTPHYKGAVKGKYNRRHLYRRKRYADGETW